jgi:amidase
MKDEIIGYDAIALGELIRKGEIKPTELLETVIQRIEKINPKINAVIHKMYDQAREVAKAAPAEGVFSGVPFLLKDMFAEYKDAPFEEGSRAVQGYTSKLDSELVKRQKAAGLNTVGKTNTCEFGLLPTTEPKLNGPTLNPWNPELTPGGSSGGSAAAVAAGIVPIAHGNDGGGSIRCPASCCGIFGLKPTRGRNPMGPLFGDGGGGLAAEHAIARTVRDSAALLDATSGPDIGDPYYAPPKERLFLEEVGREPKRLKIGFLTAIPEGWSLQTQIHRDCQRAVKDAARLCESIGHIVEEIDPNELSQPNLFQIFGHIFTCFAGRVIAYWEEELDKKITEDQVEPMTWASYQSGLKRTGADYLGRVEKIQRFSRKIARWYYHGGYDMLLSPTLSIPPVKLGSFDPTPEDPMSGFKTTSAFVAFTSIQNITGQPAMSVPLYWNEDNIPIGVQFAGRFGDEAGLFRLAAQLERERPWGGGKPPIHCSNHED